MDVELEIPDDLIGSRLDQALASLFPDYSRSRLTQWIRAGEVTVDGHVRRPKDKVSGGEQIVVRAHVEIERPPVAQAIELDIVFHDEHLLVLNKPAGLVVHPGAGNSDGTLANALLHFDAQLADLPRAGIVHRLDKDTSGLMVVARSLVAHKYLTEQIQAREVHREYLAVVHGVVTGGGRVEAPIARHRVHRTRMAVAEDGRYAATEYRIGQRYRIHTELRCKLETGRTHQIRVHMSHIRYPLVGDPVYGGRPRIPRDASDSFIAVLRGFRRQALHATRLGLQHPISGEELFWECPPPADYCDLIEAMKIDQADHAG